MDKQRFDTALELCNNYFRNTGETFSLEIIRSKSRKSGIVNQRVFVANLLHAHGYKCKEIGHFINRHHATVLYSIGSLTKQTYFSGKATRYLRESVLDKVVSIKKEARIEYHEKMFMFYLDKALYHSKMAKSLSDKK